MIWLWLLKNWKLGIAGIAILAALAYVGAMKWQIHSLRGQIVELTADIGKVRAKVAEKESLIEVQNGYVEAWKEAGVKNAELRQAAEKRSQALARNAANIPVPVPPPTNDCSCAIPRESWLRDELNKSLWRD